jgi:alpha-tubulin suppressor-like RCC1 family protein
MDEAGEVPGLTDVTVVAGGTGVSTVLKKDGTVSVWGANWHGQFGDGGYTDNPGVDHDFELVPRPVPGISNVAAISVGIADGTPSSC